MNKSLLIAALLPLLLLVPMETHAITPTKHDCIKTTIIKDVSAFMGVSQIAQNNTAGQYA